MAGSEEMKECFKCHGELVKNTILKEVDFVCQRCGRGWKKIGNRWHTRFTAIEEIYDLEGNQRIDEMDY